MIHAAGAGFVPAPVFPPLPLPETAIMAITNEQITTLSKKINALNVAEESLKQAEAQRDGALKTRDRLKNEVEAMRKAIEAGQPFPSPAPKSAAPKA